MTLKGAFFNSSWGDFNFADLMDALRHRGFQRLAIKYATFGISEIVRSAFVGLAARDLQKYIPEIKPSDIKRYVGCGFFKVNCSHFRYEMAQRSCWRACSSVRL